MEVAMGLNPKQARFAEEYAASPNATQAAIRAGYSERSAGQIGERLLRNDEIAKAVERARQERSKRIGIDGDRVLLEFARVAFLDARKLFNPDGSLKRLDELDDDVAAAIAGLDVNELRDADGFVIGRAKKIKLVDKLGALSKLAQHLGLLDPKITIKGDAQNPLQVLLKQVQGSAFKPVPWRATNDPEDDKAA
jgi:phage terminase small subunit